MFVNFHKKMSSEVLLICKLLKISFQKRVCYKNKLSILCFVTYIMCM